MKAKGSQFPLPLSSLTSLTGSAERCGAAYAPAQVATPQTATRNAQRSAGLTPGAALIKTGAAPSKSHSEAMQRARPAAPCAPRAHLLVSDAIRRQMVARVARRGVRDVLVLAALEQVPRHRFIEPALSAQAYIDASLPIGHQQTISQPYMVARMIEVLRSGAPLGRVLEIGTGCGYQAAVLARVAQQVVSIERIRPLHELARANVRPLQIANLRLQYGDGMLGLPQLAPFDGIILAAAGLDVPQALLEQLAIGGRLVAPVGAHDQHLHLITRSGQAQWTRTTLESCRFVPLRPGTA